MKIFINHIGYRPCDKKIAIIEGPKELENGIIKLLSKETGEFLFEAKAKQIGPVDNWKNWNFLVFDFSSYVKEGKYSLIFFTEEKVYNSETFEIKENILREKTLSDLLYYFKTMRCSGEYDKKDKNAHILGTDRVKDVHGGWYDASGDTSKYLSHLSYTNFLNPQQTPMVVWNLIDSLEELKRSGKITGSEMEKRFLEEIYHGADFLQRMQDESGFFYMTLFDQWSKDLDKRVLCSYKGQDGVMLENYQAAYRQGGGVTIAALARTHQLLPESDRENSPYLKAAIKGFVHLEEHNLKYLNDNKENIIDDYCGLLAATELYNSTKKDLYLKSAELRANNLVKRQRINTSYEGWFCADEGNRPYFHGSEAGLPVISLLRFLEVKGDSSKDLIESITKTIKKSLEFELAISKEVNNPFGYARQYIKGENEEARSAFFMPHNNSSGYWWQGENARIASLALSALKTSAYFKHDEIFATELKSYALNQLNWIVGCNPFNMSMLHGFGANNPAYEKDFINVPGGIANGITSGYSNERDIDFAPFIEGELGDHSWRWSEQWIPHASWFLIAISYL